MMITARTSSENASAVTLPVCPDAICSSAGLFGVSFIGGSSPKTGASRPVLEADYSLAFRTGAEEGRADSASAGGSLAV